jgi:hypothetical protein
MRLIVEGASEDEARAPADDVSARVLPPQS